MRWPSVVVAAGIAAATARAQEPESQGEPLSRWVEKLRQGESRWKSKWKPIEQAFREMGPRAAPAIPDLLKLLADEEVQFDAATCLAHIGKPAVPGLIAALNDKSESVRWAAATAFETMAVEDALAAGPTLLDRLRTLPPFDAMRDSAGRALGRMQFEPDRVIPEMVRRVVACKPGEKDWAVMAALSAYGETAIPRIVAALPDAGKEGWGGLVWSLANMEQARSKVVPILIGLLRSDTLDIDSRESGHGALVTALASCGPDALPSLVAMLSEERAELRWRALRVLADTQPERHALPAFDAVRAAAKDPDERVRRAAADALGQAMIGEKPEAFGVLLEMLRGDASSSVRAEAALFLGYARGQPDELRANVAAALVEAAGEADDALQQNALRALGLLGERSDAVKRLILARIEKGSADVRYLAATSAGELHLAEAVPALMRLLDGDDVGLASGAIRALGWIGPPAKAALPKLREKAAEGVPWVPAAQEAIERIEAR